uniref:Peptidase S59 domain-containing protein n=1 Tax=Hippocampus comes TaxID=109280 RepID=A0A3Q2Y2C6_HIPCM
MPNSIKKLVLKNLNSSQYSSPANKDSDDLALLSAYPQNGHSQTEDDEPRAAPAADDPEVTHFYVNPIAKPVPQGRAPCALQDTICELNMHKATRNGLELSSEDASASLCEESLQEERDDVLHEANQPPHPAGIVLRRVGYYTIPSMDELSDMVDDSGECVVDNFTVGRKGDGERDIRERSPPLRMIGRFTQTVTRLALSGYGSIFFPGTVNVTGLDLDQIVHFRRKEVIVYPDDKNKPAEGEGLNRCAGVRPGGRRLDFTRCVSDASRWVQAGRGDAGRRLAQRQDDLHANP